MIKVIEKWRQFTPSVKASIVFLFASVLTKGISFLSTPIFTRIMSESDIGLVGTFFALRGIYETIATLSLTSVGVVNVGMAQHIEDRKEYLSSLLGFCLCFSLVIGFLFLLVSTFFPPLEGRMKTVFIYLMITHSLFTPATAFWIMRERYEFRYKKVFLVISLQAVLSQVFAIIAVCTVNNHLDEARLIALALIEYPIGIYFTITLLLKGKRFFNCDVWKKTLLFALPLIPHYLSSVVLTGSDRIMINYLESEMAAGIYTVVYGVGSVGTIVWGAVQGSVTPILYERISSGNRIGIQTLSKQLIVFFGVICFLISLLAPEVIRFLGPQSYLSGMYVVPPVIGAILVSSLYNLFATVVFYYKKPGFIAIASTIAAIVNIVLNFIFIPIYGFIAAGYTTLISYLVLAIMHYINLKKIHENDFFNSRQLFIICGIFLIMCMLSSLLYDYNLIRYLIVMVAIFSLLHKRELVLKLLIKR